jgi:ABC-type glycerol-3-phosphate transport system substrate-binding protein
MKHTVTLILLLAMLFFTAACQDREADNPDEPTSQATTVPDSADTPAPATVDTPPPILPDNNTLTVTVWVATQFYSLEEEVAGQIVSRQIQEFADRNPDIAISVAAKVSSGQGGILSYLRTGRSVAPGAMPDLVLLPADQLASAISEQLVYPLEPWISADLLADLYPAADTLGRVDQVIVGYPYVLRNLTHLAFDRTVFTETVPATWQGVLQSPARLIVPAAGTTGADIVQQTYLALDGEFGREDGHLVLDVDTLSNVLAFFNQARQDGNLLIESSNIATYEEAWNFYRNGQANMVPVTADLFLRQRASGQDTGFAPIPGPQDRLLPQVDAWVWAISSPDTARQQIASQLIAWLISEDNLGEVSLATLSLPSRRGALERWPADDPYIAFLKAELELARANPMVIGASGRTALSAALFEVISTNSSPQVAAEEANNRLSE